jgi:CBS domain-containing protein
MGRDDVTVRQIMSTEIVSVGPSSTVAEAATLMGKQRVGSALVMDGDTVMGIFTERDIVRALAADFDAAGHEVADWMTALAGGYRHLPVVEDGATIGIVSIRDLSRAAVER